MTLVSWQRQGNHIRWHAINIRSSSYVNQTPSVEKTLAGGGDADVTCFLNFQSSANDARKGLELWERWVHLPGGFNERSYRVVFWEI